MERGASDCGILHQDATCDPRGGRGVAGESDGELIRAAVASPPTTMTLKAEPVFSSSQDQDAARDKEAAREDDLARAAAFNPREIDRYSRK